MKTIIKLLIVVAVCNAVIRSASAAWTFYQFKDATHEIITFGTQTTTTELRDQIVARAEELDVPVLPGDVIVRRRGARTTAEATYTQPVELFPRFVHQAQFSFTVAALSVLGTGPQDPPER